MTEENIFEREMQENYTLDYDVGNTSKWGPEYEKKVINLSKRVVLLCTLYLSSG